MHHKQGWCNRISDERMESRIIKKIKDRKTRRDWRAFWYFVQSVFFSLLCGAIITTTSILFSRSTLLDNIIFSTTLTSRQQQLLDNSNFLITSSLSLVTSRNIDFSIIVPALLNVYIIKIESVQNMNFYCLLKYNHREYKLCC